MSNRCRADRAREFPPPAALEPDLAVIPVRTPFAVGTANCYLLLGKPLTLVDAGPRTPEALEDLEAGLAAHDIAISDIELMLFTHQHADHMGLAGTIRRRSAGKVAASRPLAAYLDDVAGSQKAETDYQAEVLRLHGAPTETVDRLREIDVASRTFSEGVEVDEVVGEGAEINAGGRRLVCRARPGHSPTDTIFIDESLRTAFVGDHLIRNVASNPVVHRPIDGPADPRRRTSTLIRYRESLAATAAEEHAVLYAGHGRPFDDHRTLISTRLAAQTARNEDVLRRFGDQPASAFGVACALWPTVPVQQAYLTLSAVLGACDMLVAEGRLEQVEGTQIVYRAVQRSAISLIPGR